MSRFPKTNRFKAEALLMLGLGLAPIVLGLLAVLITELLECISCF